MTGLLITLALLAIAVWLIKRHFPSPPAVDADPEQVLKAATELHKIRRRLDVAWTRTEMRNESARVGREIASALNDEESS